MVFIIGLFCLSRVDFRIFLGFVNYWDAGKTNTVREFASLEKLKKKLSTVVLDWRNLKLWKIAITLICLYVVFYLHLVMFYNSFLIFNS